MRIYAVIIIVIAFFVSAGLAAAQKISESEYKNAESAAMERIASLDRRVTKTSRFFTGEQLTGLREEKSEYSGRDAERHLISEKFGRSNSEVEIIKVGGAMFCSDEKKKWKVSEESCAEEKNLPLPSGDYEYFVETDPQHPGQKTYIKKADFPKDGAQRKDGMDHIEIKFWVSDNGITGRREFRRGTLESGEWSSIVDTKYEVVKNGLRIEAPVN